jgi:probable HAF family extracellular repeat protein
MVTRTRAVLFAFVVLMATGCWHDVGALDETYPQATAYGINDRGDVVGWSAMGASGHAFVRNINGGDMVDLTPNLSEDQGSSASAVNKDGIVVGTINRPDPASHFRAPFTWWAFTGLDVLPLPEGTTDAEAVDIDDRGFVLVVGYTTRPTDEGRTASFVWDPGRRAYTPLPPATPGGTAVGFRFDGRGGVVGSASVPIPDGRVIPTAAVWAPGTLAVRTLPHTKPRSEVFDVNKNGMLVGYQTDYDYTKVAVYWPSADALPVELPGEEANAVNDAGQIVGRRVSNPAEGYRAAVLWEPGRGRTTDLGDKAGGSEAHDINASGRSVGYTAEPGNRRSAVWWDPPAP